MTTTRTPHLLQFWTTLTPVQRAILATTAEIHINERIHHDSFMATVGERLTRIEKESESGEIGELTTNICDYIEDQLVQQGADATPETVIKGLLARE